MEFLSSLCSLRKVEGAEESSDRKACSVGGEGGSPNFQSGGAEPNFFSMP
jgi:hypothetical protein